jgi:hypothetical protein
MMAEIKGRRILHAARGMEAVDQDELAVMLIKSVQIGHDIGQMAEIDLNPVIISGKKTVIVDALMILA